MVSIEMLERGFLTLFTPLNYWPVLPFNRSADDLPYV
jgi:hypothetical protein